MGERKTGNALNIWEATSFIRDAWETMRERLYRTAARLTQEAERDAELATRISPGHCRDFPWAIPVRAARRRDAAEHHGTGALAREWASFARDARNEIDAAIEKARGDLRPSVPADEDDGVGADKSDSRGAPRLEWDPSERLTDRLTAIRIPETGAFADLRTDLMPALTVYELRAVPPADPDAPPSSGRFFRLDNAGDWPRIEEVTEEVRGILSRRLSDAQATIAKSHAARDRALQEAGSRQPIDVLKERKLVGSFRVEGRSGERHRTILDANDEIGAPAAVAATPLVRLYRSGRIDAGQYEAGENVAFLFAAAEFSLGRGLDYGRVTGPLIAAEPPICDEADRARKELNRVMTVAGGRQSAAANALWEVVGMQRPLDEFAASRHFHLPGGQRFLTTPEAECAVRVGLALARADLDAVDVEAAHRRNSMTVQFEAGRVILSFGVGRGPRFRVVGRYDPDMRAWVGERMVPAKARPGSPPRMAAQWCVRAGDLDVLARASIAEAARYVEAAIKDATRRERREEAEGEGRRAA